MACHKQCANSSVYLSFIIPHIISHRYQARRHASKPPPEEPEEKKPKQTKKKAMTEEEMLAATRKRQKNRKGEGPAKTFQPGKEKKKRGAKGKGGAGMEDNIGGVITELQIKTVS